MTYVIRPPRLNTKAKATARRVASALESENHQPQERKGNKVNSVTVIAASKSRDYITPEDVSQALRMETNTDKVRRDVLEVLGKQTTFGAEDAGLCAFIAWRGTPTPTTKGK